MKVFTPVHSLKCRLKVEEKQISPIALHSLRIDCFSDNRLTIEWKLSQKKTLIRSKENQIEMADNISAEKLKAKIAGKFFLELYWLSAFNNM